MGFELIRARPHEAWRKDIGRFDCIYVDGLHDYLSTFEDMALWFFRMTPKGTMIVDDYGFVGWPEKTKAVNDFIRIAEPPIDALGYRSYHVYTGLAGNWPIPAEKSNVLIRAGDLSDERVVQDVIRKMKAVLADGKRLDVFPNVSDLTAG